MSTLVTWIIKFLSGISSDQWKTILQLVIAAEERITAGIDKRAWVLDKLKGLGITGSTANFLVEAALAWLKKQGQA